MPRLRSKISRTEGQATVAFVACVPLIVVVCLLVVQAGLVGYAAWSAANAARAGARAAHVGSEPEAAAEAALPGGLRARSRVEVDGEEVSVGVRATKALPGVGPFEVVGSAALGEGE